jgi:hypothetical protein
VYSSVLPTLYEIKTHKTFHAKFVELSYTRWFKYDRD